MSFYLALTRGGGFPLRVDGFYLVAREATTLHTIVRQLGRDGALQGLFDNGSARMQIDTQVLLCPLGTPSLPLNTDARLVHPTQIIRSSERMQYEFVPMAYLSPDSRGRVMFADRQRWLNVAGGMDRETVEARGVAFAGEAPEMDLPNAPALSDTSTPRPGFTEDELMRMNIGYDPATFLPDQTAITRRTKDGKWTQAWPVPEKPKPVKVTDARQRFVRRRRDD